MGLVAYVLWMLPSLFSVVGIGGLAVIARLVGAGERREAAHVARQSLLVGCIAAVIAMALTSTCAGAFVAAMQLRGEPAALASRYIRILTIGIPFVMVEQVGTACLRGAGDTVSGLMARVVVNVVNAVVSTGLVTGFGFFPEIGWTGLAIGATSGHCIGGLVILFCLARRKGVLHVAAPTEDRARWSRLWSADWPTMRRILQIGVPGEIDIWAVLACHLTYASAPGEGASQRS